MHIEGIRSLYVLLLRNPNFINVLMDDPRLEM